MVYSDPQPSLKLHFDEIVIANFGSFQIAVPTTTRLVQRKVFSAYVPVPDRLYRDCGWLIHNSHVVANIDRLEVGSIFSEKGPFKPVHRLSPSVPVSFEVQSSHALPAPIANAAVFACSLEDANFPYHTVFRKVSPYFVRIYPLGQQMTLLKHVHKFLADEAMFVTQNAERLKNVPFFQAHLSL